MLSTNNWLQLLPCSSSKEKRRNFRSSVRYRSLRPYYVEFSSVQQEHGWTDQFGYEMCSENMFEWKISSTGFYAQVPLATALNVEVVQGNGQRASPQRSFTEHSSHSAGSERSRSATPTGSAQVSSRSPGRSKHGDKQTSPLRVKLEDDTNQKIIVQALPTVMPMDTDKAAVNMFRAYKEESSSQAIDASNPSESPELGFASEARESASQDEPSVAEQLEQNGWPPNKRMKSVLQDTSVRNARVSVRTRTDAPTV